MFIRQLIPSYSLSFRWFFTIKVSFSIFGLSLLVGVIFTNIISVIDIVIIIITATILHNYVWFVGVIIIVIKIMAFKNNIFPRFLGVSLLRVVFFVACKYLLSILLFLSAVLFFQLFSFSSSFYSLLFSVNIFWCSFFDKLIIFTHFWVSFFLFRVFVTLKRSLWMLCTCSSICFLY